jgi:predicted ATPase/class 3 adenylate cyclase
LLLGDRAFEVLRVLASANGAVVSKDELLDQVWAGVTVEENNLQVQISTLRKALDPEGAGESWIVTVPGRGYRLLGVENSGSYPHRPPAGTPLAEHQSSDLAGKGAGGRRLIAVVYADIVGYSRLIGLDDAGTLRRLRTLRRSLIDPEIREFGGRIAQTAGDSLLMAFDSIDGALRCAIKLQQEMPAYDGDQPLDRRMRFRIGIDMGDAIPDGTDLHGDAVNVAARLQAECPPGGVCISRSIRDHVHGRLDLAFEELGPLHLKNIARPVEAFVVRLGAAELATAYPNNLPQLAQALIGRERDAAEVEALLHRYRLVTLVGAAGVGKTSLSLQVGSNLLVSRRASGRSLPRWAPGFPDGVWFVELASLGRSELVGEAVAAAFGLPVHGERPATDAVAAFLRSRRVLLILDNCEHVIATVAKLADALLKTCPGVHLLASSREALSISGEHAYPVPLLDVPPRSKSLTADQAMGHSAVHLFVERAAAALGRFELTDESAPIVAEICGRLDGIPLAIELAAPRLKMLAPNVLLARLDDRLRLLKGASRVAVPRQQTLRAAIEWSYALLSVAEQAMLRRLGVFAGSFTLEAVVAVASGPPVERPEVFDVLAGLVDKSLVVSLGGESENRYRLFESTRAFAREKVRDDCYPALARRLCEHMTIVFEQAERTWPTTPRADWLPVYEPDLDNLRAALGWSLRLDGDPALGVNLLSHTDWIWRELGFLQERMRWFELGLTFIDNTTLPAVEARIRLALGWNLVWGIRGNLSHNVRAIELMRQVGGEPVLLGQALDQAGSSTRRYRDVAEAKQYYDEALSVLRRCGRTKRLASALLGAGHVRKDARDLKAARPLIEEALAISNALGDIRTLVACETQVAVIEFAVGQTAQAIDRARRAVEMSHRGTLATEFTALLPLAAFLIFDGQTEPGRAAAIRSFELSRALGNVGFHSSIELLALFLAGRGETDTAARLAGFAESYSNRHQISPAADNVAIRSRLVQRLHSAMRPEECHTAMAAGAAWSEQEAVAVAQTV